MEHAKFWKEFFQLYKDLPALWRVKSTEYTDRILKSNCYMKLITKLSEIYPDADRDMVVRKINNFRTSYRKELKRLKESKQLGKMYKPTLWYFNYLRFLDDQDESWTEKHLNEIENTEEQQQGNQNFVTNSVMVNKKLPMKRDGDFKESEEEIIRKPMKRKILAQHYHKRQSPRKPSFAEQQQAKIEADILAKSWAVQYKDMKTYQKLISRKLISDILFYGCMGTLNMSHIVDLQEIFQKETTNLAQDFNLQVQSPRESNSSFRFAEQECGNYGLIRESPIEFDSSSLPMSPTENSMPEVQINDIKFELP